MSEKHDTQLQKLREDFACVHGEPFKHFHCPMTGCDEPGDLCLGHVIPEGLGRSSKKEILQRKDVDSFYGTVVENDMIAFLKAQTQSIDQLLINPILRKSLRPRLLADGMEIPYYKLKNGNIGPNHTPATISSEQGDVQFVFAKSSEELSGLSDQDAVIVIDRDCTHMMIAALLKAAHLTLFHMLGYSYALSAGGYLIGKDVLGKFFDDFRANPASGKEALPEYFDEWRNAVRPIASIGANDFRGTVDDGRVFELHSSTGHRYAIGVFIRTNEIFHQVILPGEPGSIATYLEFIQSPPEYYHAKIVKYDRSENCWITDKSLPQRCNYAVES